MGSELSSLEEVELEEVSIVDVPANGARIAMSKSDKGDFVEKVLKNTSLNMEAVFPLMDKLSNPAQEAATAILKLKKSMGSDLPLKALLKMMEQEKMDHDDMEKMDHDDTEKMDHDDMEKEDHDDTEKMNYDEMEKEDDCDDETEKGSMYKSADPMLQKILKQNRELKAMLQKAEAARLKTEWIAKAKQTLSHVPEKPEVMAHLFKKLTLTDKAAASTVYDILKKCDALIKKGQIVKSSQPEEYPEDINKEETTIDLVKSLTDPKERERYRKMYFRGNR